MEETADIRPGRRGFLQGALAYFVGAGGAAVIAAMGAYLYPPSLRRRSSGPVRVPGAESLSPGDTAPVRIDGEPALLMKIGDGYRALSLTCTHLGCVVRWRPEGGDSGSNEAEKKDSTVLSGRFVCPCTVLSGRFVCPCHGGIYDTEGKVISGPPPAPLARLEVQVRDGRVFIV
jgi:cytochrome b6-f complex iron-sulfur subunit